MRGKKRLINGFRRAHYVTPNIVRFRIALIFYFVFFVFTQATSAPSSVSLIIYGIYQLMYDLGGGGS